MPQLSIIIPTLNEEETILSLLHSLSGLAKIDHEIIIVDGGSTDQTCDRVEQLGLSLLRCSGGRGSQLRYGALQSRGEYLLFLHADSILSSEGRDIVQKIVEEKGESLFQIGLFRLHFDRSSFLYRLYSLLARFDSVWTTFGDQGILISREHYNRIGGFPPYPLFEDVEFLRRARRHSPIRKFRAEIITSARRFESIGSIRNQLRNFILLRSFLAGVEPEVLARNYRSE